MAERFSQSGYFAVGLSSQNALASMIETESSESRGSQIFGINFPNLDDVLASESDDDSRSISTQITSHNVIINETDPSESESSQESVNEFVVDREVSIPETPSQSDQERTPNHSQEPSNESSSIPCNLSAQNSLANIEVLAHLNCSEIYEEEENIDENEVDESDNDQASEDGFRVNGELSIPETPSQSDQESIPEHSQKSENELPRSSYHLTIHSPIAQPRPLSLTPTNFGEVLAYSSEDEEELSPIDSVFIHETDPSESENSRESEAELQANNNEVGVPETPSQSDHEHTPAHSQSNQSESPKSPSQLTVQSRPETSPLNSDDSQQANNSDLLSQTIGNVLVYETDDNESDNSEISENDFVINSEISIPETPSESEEEYSSNQSENESHQASNPSTIPNPPLISVDDLRYSNRSPDLFDDDDIPDNIILNNARDDTEPLIEANLSEILNEIAPNDSQDVDIIPPSNEFPFLLPALLQNDHENDAPLAVPIEISSSSESDGDDDDETILRIENSPIQISEQSSAIIERIEAFILGMINDIKNGNKIQIVVQNRQSWANCLFENERFSLLPISDARCRRIKSTFSLSLIFYVLGEIHELLLTNRTCTVRELYYKDVNLTQRQENVSEALKTICCILDATPWELGVLSTSKGLIAGPVQIHLTDNSVIDCSVDRNGMTLPYLTAGIVDLRTTATHILVVEKDTVFKKLLQNNIIGRWNNECILITGEGYPCQATRLMLHKLRELFSLPINVFTDADPYGIEIMLTYRHGSLSMSNLAESLAVPSVRWLGIFPSDIRKFGINAVPLTVDDKRKLDNILSRPFINDHVHRELLIMKQHEMKAEIEGISDSSCTYLIDVYLCNKIQNNEGI